MDVMDICLAAIEHLVGKFSFVRLSRGVELQQNGPRPLFEFNPT
jgi:hypothetical protein